MSRNEMLILLVRNELEFLIGDPTPENIEMLADFFASGGFSDRTDDEMMETISKWGA